MSAACLPISFCGGPDRVVEQIRRCRRRCAGVLDVSLQDPGTGENDAMMHALEFFGKRSCAHPRDLSSKGSDRGANQKRLKRGSPWPGIP